MSISAGYQLSLEVVFHVACSLTKMERSTSLSAIEIWIFNSPQRPRHSQARLEYRLDPQDDMPVPCSVRGSSANPLRHVIRPHQGPPDGQGWLPGAARSGEPPHAGVCVVAHGDGYAAEIAQYKFDLTWRRFQPNASRYHLALKVLIAQGYFDSPERLKSADSPSRSTPFHQSRTLIS